MANNLHLPVPRLSVTVDPNTWTPGTSIDTVTSFAVQAASNRLRQTSLRLDADYSSYNAVDAMTDSSRPLRIMGITSRFTTFLQYSMRDWLEAFEQLGHDTMLVIEPQDAAQFNAITFAEECQRFRPDMIVMIDHFRGEFAGLPTNIPFVMWIQDQLPHLFSDHAGQAQKECDYTIGYGRDDCVYKHGYPADRFMPAMVGTNPRRFIPRRIRGDEYERFACDVSFVSHCSTPAKALLDHEIAKQSTPESKRVLSAIFERLQARYDAGESVTMRHEFMSIIGDVLGAMKMRVDNAAPLLNIFTHKINNALFRHQALEWLAELDVRLHLYGRGWENNPTFARLRAASRIMRTSFRRSTRRARLICRSRPSAPRTSGCSTACPPVDSFCCAPVPVIVRIESIATCGIGVLPTTCAPMQTFAASPMRLAPLP